MDKTKPRPIDWLYGQRQQRERSGKLCLWTASAGQAEVCMDKAQIPEPRQVTDPNQLRRKGSERKLVFKRLDEDKVMLPTGLETMGIECIRALRRLEALELHFRVTSKTYDGKSEGAQKITVKDFPRSAAKTKNGLCQLGDSHVHSYTYWKMRTSCEFDDLLQRTIDSYDDLKRAFLENYLRYQIERALKDPEG
ncbi:hypothetical protein Tco_0985664 [Tanacetum coccineum]